MLGAIRRARETINHLVDEDDTWASDSNAAHQARCRMADVQRDLADVREDATTVDRE